jgi:hypothetical protein
MATKKLSPPGPDDKHEDAKRKRMADPKGKAKAASVGKLDTKLHDQASKGGKGVLNTASGPKGGGGMPKGGGLFGGKQAPPFGKKRK